MAVYKRYKKDDLVSYSLGITLTMELLKYKKEYARMVYVHSTFRQGDTYDKLESLCRECNVELRQADKIFHVLSQKENCFVIGEFEKFPEGLRQEESHIVLVNPSNAGNLGTILRSALGFGLNHIAIIRPAADIFDPKVVRASMGAVFCTEFSYFDTFEDYCRLYGERSFYPFMLDADVSIHEFVPLRPFSLIFGNEATGLPKDFAGIGTSVIIPHADKIDSLNLPIAASIAMFAATREDFT